MKATSNAGRSSRREEEKEWTSLWGVTVPSKIRVFLWRLARSSLPSKDVLHHRNMADNSSCSICGATDSWKHSLLECNMSKSVWALEKDEITELLSETHEHDAKGWLLSVMKNLAHDDLVRVATRPQRGEKIVVQGRPRWIPPPAGMMKINVDAALSKNSGIASAAAVARDIAGNFLGASALVTDGITNPETMEAIACREGMALASDLALQSFRLACDNSNVIRSIKDIGMGIYGHIVQEIKERAGGFRSTEFVHAHNLARGSIYANVGRHVWFMAPPDGVCITRIIE
ncbi:hypothetical protein EJB05_25426, partial [Eragrostis curvula]